MEVSLLTNVQPMLAYDFSLMQSKDSKQFLRDFNCSRFILEAHLNK